MQAASIEMNEPAMTTTLSLELHHCSYTLGVQHTRSEVADGFFTCAV